MKQRNTKLTVKHHVRTVPKSHINMVENGKIDTPNTQNNTNEAKKC